MLLSLHCINHSQREGKLVFNIGHDSTLKIKERKQLPTVPFQMGYENSKKKKKKYKKYKYKKEDSFTCKIKSII